MATIPKLTALDVISTRDLLELADKHFPGEDQLQVALELQRVLTGVVFKVEFARAERP